VAPGETVLVATGDSGGSLPGEVSSNRACSAQDPGAESDKEEGHSERNEGSRMCEPNVFDAS
jgi:hypothetical protein